MIWDPGCILVNLLAAYKFPVMGSRALETIHYWKSEAKHWDEAWSLDAAASMGQLENFRQTTAEYPHYSISDIHYWRTEAVHYERHARGANCCHVAAPKLVPRKISAKQPSGIRKSKSSEWSVHGNIELSNIVGMIEEVNASSFITELLEKIKLKRKVLSALSSIPLTSGKIERHNVLLKWIEQQRREMAEKEGGQGQSERPNPRVPCRKLLR